MSRSTPRPRRRWWRWGRGPYLVRVDYTNKSAQVIDHAGRTVWIYGPGIVRHTLNEHLRRDGWVLTRRGTWTVSPVPDGRDHPVRKSPRINGVRITVNKSANSR
jgi:outer membrane lipoprotein-sorting protein